MSTTKLLWLAPVLFFAACAEGSNADYYAKSSAAAPESTEVADSATVTAEQAPMGSPRRKVVRTADFRCKVNNVFTATTALENMVKSVGGIVQDSRIDNASSDVYTTYYTEDSLRRSQTFTTTSALTLRVPVAHLDSILQAIPGMTSFIDSRTLKQSDVTYHFMANELKSRINENRSTTARAMELAKKNKDPIEVQEYENNREEKKIDRRIENMQIIDDVTYATVTVAFYQPEQVLTQIVIDPSYYTQSPFSLKCKEALYSGWSFFKAFIIAIINIWPILLLAIIAWFVFRRVKIRRFAIVRR